MKASRISEKICNKMNDWLESLPEKERNYLRPRIVVTGGAITSMFLREKVNDYDVYFSSIKAVLMAANHYARTWAEDATAPCKPQLRLTFNGTTKKLEELGSVEKENFRAVTSPDSPLVKMLLNDDNNYNLGKLERVEIFISSAGVAGENPDNAEDDYDEEEPKGTVQHHATDSEEESGGRQKYYPAFMSSNAITLNNKVQLVLRFFGPPEKIHETYDFVHATNYWTSGTGLVTNARALEAILARELVYTGSKYPLASIFRTRKFIKRGWNIHIGNYVKMAMQLNSLDLSDVHVLEEQLTGVDAAYLGGIIRACKDLSEKPDFDASKIESYVCELCDRMMGERNNGEAENDE